MATFRFTNSALDDLIAIWDYTLAQWSEHQAEKYYNLIMASCIVLANNLQRGKSYAIIFQKILGYKCGVPIIFYHEIEKNKIVRVLHGMMHLKSKI